jgi:competence protein ComEC
VRDDVPAALPLIAVAAALAAAPALVHPYPTAAGLAVVALLVLRKPRLAAATALLAAAVMAGTRHHQMLAMQSRELAALDRDLFVTVEAPIERDWAPRPHYTVLRASRFRAGSRAVDAPLSIYVRFSPPPIGMEAVVRAEGHLKPDRRGGYAMSVKSPRLLSYAGRLSPWSPAAWNRAIANRLRKHAAARPSEIAMIEALLLGRGERLSEQTREDFRRGGTYHLLVFSGLQISLAGAAIALLLRWSGAPRAADYSLLLFSLLAPAFIGHEASVSRASTVIALFALSRIAHRPTSPENLWCVAAITRLLLVPSELYDPAFHLTYAGAGALLFIGLPLARTRLRWLAYVIGAELAIVPFTLFHFHQYALGGSLATVVMTPLVFLMLILGAGFAATELTPILDLIAAFNALCTVVNGVAAAGSGFFTAPPPVSIAAAAAGAVLALAWLRGGPRTASLILVLAMPSLAAIVVAHGRARVAVPQLVMLDVGQGEAILIRSGAGNVLVDGGGRHGDARFGESVLLPQLLERGARRIDVALLTHAHPDHCVGLAAAVRHLQVGELWVSPRRFRGDCARLLLEAAQSRATPVRIIRGGETISLGDVEGRTIVAAGRYRRAPENNHSVLLLLRANRRSVLLTGDIEKDAERDLTGVIPHAEILKIPHHGSRTSTSAPLLDAVRPRLALVSCGRDNVFGHPHPAVLHELNRRGVRVWRTDRDGSITVELGSSVRVRAGVHR